VQFRERKEALFLLLRWPWSLLLLGGRLEVDVATLPEGEDEQVDRQQCRLSVVVGFRADSRASVKLNLASTLVLSFLLTS
jgi:hypothetical protein